MTGFGGTQFDGAGAHPLLADWVQWKNEPAHIWAQEYQILADRGLSLACNDAFAAALAGAVVMGTLGPVGLKSVSLWDNARGSAETTDRAHNIRRLITAVTDGSWDGTGLDAEGIRTRRDLEQALAWSAFVLGEGWAIRVAGVGGRSAWRIVDPARIKNPNNAPNTPTLRDGMTFANGRVSGIWVTLGIVGGFGAMRDAPPMWIPWTAEDGTPNVIHRTGLRLPNMIRGVSRLAPMIILLRQVHGVLESHVAAKRLQAVQAMIVEAEDPEAYRLALASGDALGSPSLQVRGPLNIWVKPPGSKVDFNDPKFNGADLADYLTMVYKVGCAVEQVPVDVVLCQMGNASLSSARAGLDQFDRTCQGNQEQHIAQVSEPMDRVALADAWALGEIDLPTTDWRRPLVAKYNRPPKYSTDRKKDAETVKALMDAKVSGTTAFQTIGLSWEDEQELLRAEAQFTAAQAQPAETAQTTAPADDTATDPALEPVEPEPSSWWRRALSWARITHRGAA